LNGTLRCYKIKCNDLADQLSGEFIVGRQGFIAEFVDGIIDPTFWIGYRPVTCFTQKAWLVKNFPKHFIKGHWHKTPGFPGREDDEVIFDAISENVIMAATKKSTTGSRSKTGPKDKSYV
jgi:hypothetical protein